MSVKARRLMSASLLALVFVTALIASLGGPTPAEAQQPVDLNEAAAAVPASLQKRVGPTVSQAASDSKKAPPVSYQRPHDTLVYEVARHRAGPGATPAQIEAAGKQFLKEWAKTAYHGPDPAKQAQILRNEQVALKNGTSVEKMGQALTGTLRLLAVLVEFDGTDTAENFSHPLTVLEERDCITETVTFSGPLHNEIAAPGPRDNNSVWAPNFDRNYFERLVFSTEGITERLRLDLTDPEDGQPGINIAGKTMRNYYEEVSGGRVQFDGGPKGVIDWVKVPHSEGYYAASACFDGEAGRIQSMNGLPTNPRFPNGMGQLLVDVVAAINASDPNFPWADYDTDGDGIIDHVVLFHAGKDKSAGGGEQGIQAIWAHRGSVDPSQGGITVDDRGTPSTADDIKLLGYTAQFEDAGAGVLVHEFGHDIGHPDLYDISGEADSDVVWWDLMSTGSHPGKLFDTWPTHMSAWSKTQLGWATPLVITPTATAGEVTLGQTSNPPVGSTQAVQVNLPPELVTYTEPPAGSTQMWWGGNDQDGADLRLTRDVNLTSVTGSISFTFDTDFVIEEDWDYMFVEVSIDGGQTYTQTKGFEVGSNIELTTPDTYPDPNGRLHDFGDVRYGYTGDSGGWIKVYHDLSPYAGQQIKLRVRYMTDEAFLERGPFLDNFKILAGTTTILNDPVEGSNLNGWTPTVAASFPGYALGQGWRFSDGTDTFPRYYLLEWRNLDGFDGGLKYTYSTVFSVLAEDGSREWMVDKLPSNVPGMLVWLRDTRFGRDPFGINNAILDPGALTQTPSEGPKGGLLVVDAHPMPLRGPLGATIDFGFGEVPYPPLNNWGARPQTTNAAFSLRPTAGITLRTATHAENPATTIITPTTYAPMAGVSAFHDALGYYPGVEALPEPVTVASTTTVLRIKKYALMDPDASTVVPAAGYYPPRTPSGFTGLGGETSPPSANVSNFETMLLTDEGYTYNALNIGATGGTSIVGQRSGNPGDSHVQYGYHFRLVREGPNGTTGVVRIWRADQAGEAGGRIEGRVGPSTITASAINVGEAFTLTLVSDFDETQATYVEGSATHGAEPIRDTPAGPITAVRKRIFVGSGATISFTYQISPTTHAPTLSVTNSVYGSAADPEPLDSITLTAPTQGNMLYLPLIIDNRRLRTR